MTVSKKHQQSVVGDREPCLCDDFEQFQSVEEVTKLAADLKIPKTEAARMLAAKGVL